MHMETTVNAVKVTFDLQKHDAGTSSVAKNVAKNLTGRQRQIIDLINENPQATRAETASTLGVSAKTIEREIAVLSDIISYSGPKKGGHWVIKTTEI